MTPVRVIPVTDLQVGDMFVTFDSALAVTAVTPGPLVAEGFPGVRVDFEHVQHVWFPHDAQIMIRDVAVIS